MEELAINGNTKRARDKLDDSDIDSAEVKRVRSDLLDVLDESDPYLDSQDLDAVMKSFVDELNFSSSSQPDLGYLLGASGDDLGLPPPPRGAPNEEEKNGSAELIRVSSDSPGIGELWEFEDQIPSYDTFDLRVGEGYNIDYVALDGLFEHSDVCFDSPVLQ